MKHEAEMTDERALEVLRIVTNRAMQGSETLDAYTHIAARLRGEGAPPEQQGGGDAVRQIIREMRERKVNHGKSSSPTLAAWANRLEAAIAQGGRDAVRALVAKWRSESTSDDQSSDYECGEHSARSECADELEAALAQQPAAVDGEMVERFKVSFANHSFADTYEDRLRIALIDAFTGEEIMVNAAHDVFTLPLQPSGLAGGPRFVVHVPGPEQPAAVDEALIADLNEYLRGCPDPDGICPTWMVKKESRLLWRCRAALAAQHQEPKS